MRQGQVKLASILFSSLVWGIVTLAAIAYGGVQTPGLFNYFSTILIASMLLGGRAAFGFAGLTIIASLGILYAEIHGMLPPPILPATSIFTWWGATSNFIMVAVLQYLALRSLNLALEQARRNERDLIQTNCHLQAHTQELARREKALQESEERFRTQYKNSPVPTYTWQRVGEDFILVDYNEAAATSTQDRVAALVGKTVKEIQPVIEADMRRCFSDKSLVKREDWFQYKSTGAIRYLILTLAFAPPDLILAQTEDLTERKQAEEALIRHAQEMEALYETSLEINAQLDISIVLNSIVRRAAKLLGTDGGGLFLVRPDGETLEMVANYNPLRQSLNFTLRFGEGVAGRVAQTQAPLIVTDYNSWAGRANNSLLIGPTGRVLGVPLKPGLGVLNVFDIEKTGIFEEADIRLLNLFAAQAAIAIKNARLHDQARQHTIELGYEVAERKRAEKALKEYSERLEEMVNERTKALQEAQERLLRQERLAVLGQLAGGVGHELRHPLGVISNAVYLLQSAFSEADETSQEYLDIIETKVREVDKIVTDLLNLARTCSVEREEIMVAVLMLEVLRRYPPPENVLVTHHLPADLPPVFINPQQIGQVLANLVANAYQAMPEGDTLTITAQTDENMLRLLLIDSGHGMSQETLKKIFEPLFTTKVKGIGLGLAVSKNLVEINGGHIEVESVEGQGSTFTLALPVRTTISWTNI
jgi:signal transduction histidine kinase